MPDKNQLVKAKKNASKIPKRRKKQGGVPDRELYANLQKKIMEQKLHLSMKENSRGNRYFLAENNKPYIDLITRQPISLDRVVNIGGIPYDVEYLHMWLQNHDTIPHTNETINIFSRKHGYNVLHEVKKKYLEVKYGIKEPLLQLRDGLYYIVVDLHDYIETYFKDLKHMISDITIRREFQNVEWIPYPNHSDIYTEELMPNIYIQVAQPPYTRKVEPSLSWFQYYRRTLDNTYYFTKQESNAVNSSAISFLNTIHPLNAPPHIIDISMFPNH